MLGAIIGDIVGSRFEWDNNRSKEFEFLTAYATRCRFKVYIYISLYKCTSDYMMDFIKFQ